MLRNTPPLCAIRVSAFLLTVGIVGSPAFALDATEKKIEDKSDVHEVTFAYPQFGVAAIDAELETFANQRHDKFKTFLAERGAQEAPYSAQLEYKIARNDDEMLAIVFAYSHYMGGAHPNMNQFSFNYLMPAASRVYLPELFTKEGFKLVSDLAIADLKPKLTGPDGMSDDSQITTGAGPYWDNFDVFVLSEEELTIYFDAYQVAAYAAGPQEVHIPLSKLRGTTRPDPLAPMASFDCAKAKSANEKAICADTGLARLDRQVADAYAWRLAWAQEEEKPGLKQSQRDWLTERDKACTATAGDLPSCLSGHYTARLKVLRMESS